MMIDRMIFTPLPISTFFPMTESQILTWLLIFASAETMLLCILSWWHARTKKQELGATGPEIPPPSS